MFPLPPWAPDTSSCVRSISTKCHSLGYDTVDSQPHTRAHTPRVASCTRVTIIVILQPARCQRTRVIFSLVPSLWRRPRSRPQVTVCSSPQGALPTSGGSSVTPPSPVSIVALPAACSPKPASHAPRAPGSSSPNRCVLRLFTCSAHTPGHVSGFLSVVASFQKAPRRSGIGCKCPLRAHKPQR